MTESNINHYRFLVFQAHGRVADRGNLSGEVIMAAFSANGNQFIPALCSGLLTLGGAHGPIPQTQALLEDDDHIQLAEGLINSDVNVPGWGNSFIKGKPDPDWSPPHNFLGEINPNLFGKLKQITELLHGYDKMVYPNPSAYTACLSIMLGYPAALSSSLFVEARLPAWRERMAKAYKGE